MSDLTPEEIQKLCIVAEALEQENARLQARVRDLEAALRSIAANTCCEHCQEAALVARAAFAAVNAEKEESDG